MSLNNNKCQKLISNLFKNNLFNKIVYKSNKIKINKLIKHLYIFFFKKINKNHFNSQLISYLKLPINIFFFNFYLKHSPKFELSLSKKDILNLAKERKKNEKLGEEAINQKLAKKISLKYNILKNRIKYFNKTVFNDVVLNTKLNKTKEIVKLHELFFFNTLDKTNNKYTANVFYQNYAIYQK